MQEPTMASRLAATLKPERQSPLFYQEWQDLLFLHWEYDPGSIQATLPEGLSVDTYDHRAYLGILPFRTRKARPRFLPPLPLLSNFPQINFRTYVYNERGVPGVWFYSLEVDQRLAVALARKIYSLPFFPAKMKVKKVRDQINFISQRPDAPADLRSFYRYAGKGAARQAEPGSLDFFLVERYVLFSLDSNSERLRTARVHHRPYAILSAEVPDWTESLFQLNGFDPPGRPPDHIAMSLIVDAAIYAFQDLE